MYIHFFIGFYAKNYNRSEWNEKHQEKNENVVACDV